jgi:selenocysteine lyase/cysteine desulfurase
MCLHARLLQAAKRSGVQIQVVPETADGDIDIQALQQLLTQQVGACVLQML